MPFRRAFSAVWFFNRFLGLRFASAQALNLTAPSALRNGLRKPLQQVKNNASATGLRSTSQKRLPLFNHASQPCVQFLPLQLIRAKPSQFLALRTRSEFGLFRRDQDIANIVVAVRRLLSNRRNFVNIEIERSPGCDN